MTVIAFHSIQLLVAAFKSRDDARRDAQRPNALTLDSLAAVVMAAASCEAFINELGEHIPVLAEATASWAPMPTALIDFATAFAPIESQRGPVTLKYLIASLTSQGRMFIAGEPPFQGFSELVRLRNGLMHLRPSDTRAQKMTAALAQRGDAYRVATGVEMEWVDRLETPETAEWACRTAREMILAVLAMIPDPDPHFEQVKLTIRSDRRFPL